MMLISKRLFKSVLICCRQMHKVFVYGTLKKDEPNHHWLTRPENGTGNFIANAVTKQKYPLVIATRYNIPFLLQSPGDGHNVQGEVYEVDDVMLGKLDELEAHPDYYTREIDTVIANETIDGTNEVKCWIYFLKNFKRDLLKQELLSNYTSKGNHGMPYTERSKRDPDYVTKSDVKG